jgi:hypothetical protein
MEDAMESSFTRVEKKISRVEEQLYRCCSGAEENFRELRNEIDASLNGWMRTIVLGAVIVTSLAVTRGR